MKTPVIDVSYGLASAYDDFIEINYKIQGSLRRKILAHERRHTKGKYKLKDFHNDFNAKNPHFFESLRFAIKNPEALINYMPVMYSYHGKFWSINYTSIFPIIYYGAIFCLLFLGLFGINVLESLILWIMLVIFANIFLLILTECYVRYVDIRPVHRSIEHR